MPVTVVTRLRLKDPALFDEFFASAVAVVEQAQNSAGNLGADVLAEVNNTYWTRTVWQGRPNERVRQQRTASAHDEPHR